ncbi:MAG: hypothetical protein WBQ69_08390 [Gallionella sp.]
MRAIIALGWRGESDTADDLAARALRHPLDIVEGMEVINSLVSLQYGSAARAALSVLKERHPAHAVREQAARALAALAGPKNGGEREIGEREAGV